MADKQKNYHQLAEQLRDKIVKGEWLSAEKIPTERALSQEFGVTRVTIRRALRVLENERLIRRMRGSGTYVNPNRSHRIPLMIDYSGSMSTHAPELQRKLIGRESMVASDSIAADLNIKTGAEILYAKRIDFNGKTAVAYDRVYIPVRFAANMKDSMLEAVDFLEVWSESCNFQITHCRQYIEAVPADRSCNEHLNVEIASPVLKSTEFYYSEHDIIAGMFISYYHPEHICISSNYNWKGGK